MKLSKRQQRDRCYQGIVWLGTAMPAVITLLRLLLVTDLRNSYTGRFTVNIVLAVVLVATLTVMLLMAPRGGSHRVDIRGKGTMMLSAGSLIAGGLIVLEGLWQSVRFTVYGELPAPAVPLASFVTQLVTVLSLAMTVVAGGVLVVFGCQVAREGGTRIGMRASTMLLPVLWMWLRLARYEMSYASAIRLDKSLYDFAMLVLELLFLFKLARYVSGIGKTRPGTLLVYAVTAGAMAVSGPLTRFGMYLLGDTQAYLASQLAGLGDLAVGILAFTFGWALYMTRRDLRRYASSTEEGSSSRGLLFDDSVRDSRQ